MKRYIRIKWKDKRVLEDFSGKKGIRNQAGKNKEKITGKKAK